MTLGELRHAGLVHSRRGSDGGYWLEADPASITLADISIAVEGSLVDLRAVPSDSTDGTADVVRAVWDEAHRLLGDVLRSTTLADVAAGRRPWDLAPVVDGVAPIGTDG